MRRTIVRIMTVAVVAATGLIPGRALAGWWGDQNCAGGASSMSTWKRTQAIGYAQPPLREGYALNGGCYRLNDKDDTPDLAADAGGEGTDCSGFVFRVWALKADGTQGYKQWDYDKDIHGPFYTWSYYSPGVDDPFRLISKDPKTTTPMDAFVYYRGEDRHIALLWEETTSGSDYVIHAHNNTVGVEISLEPYRQWSDVRAVMRKGWTLECYPKCPTPGFRRPALG